MRPPYDPESWDIFISHAWEDKEAIARPLAVSLRALGLRVWYDEFTLRVGASLSGSIDLGLAHSKYGVVIVSEHFLNKDWPQRELAALFAKEEGLKKVILPIWHGVDAEVIRRRSPVLADRVALRSSLGIADLTQQLIRVVNLDFSSGDISGIWSGETGRLRLFTPATETVEADYDWNGFDWVGHICGKASQNRIDFKWWWDLNTEAGYGYLVHDPIARSLTGGWTFGPDRSSKTFVASEYPDPRLPLADVHPWRFTKPSPAQSLPRV